MPRGGRRPGAGAPKGNFNAMTTGNNSVRMLLVYMNLVRLSDPNNPALTAERKQLGQWLVEGGFINPPRYRFNDDTKGAIEFLWRKWFDSPHATQPKAIKDLPRVRRPRPAERLRLNQLRAQQLRLVRRAKKLLDHK
jgi:hypothetical protein